MARPHPPHRIFGGAATPAEKSRIRRNALRLRQEASEPPPEDYVEDPAEEAACEARAAFYHARYLKVRARKLEQIKKWGVLAEGLDFAPAERERVFRVSEECREDGRRLPFRWSSRLDQVFWSAVD